jgi:two-component system OmpR family response regulator
VEKAGSNPRAPTVLLVDDEPEVRLVLRRFLEGQGFEVLVADTSARARELLREARIDLVLLDVGLPDGNGLALLAELRRRWQGPILIVSGQGASEERALGLELGADDYIAKPFDLREMLARIRSVLRRAQPAPQQSSGGRLAFDGLAVSLGTRRLTGRDGEDIPLTAGEFALLSALLQHPNEVLSRDHLLNVLHGRDAGPFDRAIDVQVGRLRRKIERDPAVPRLLQSVRGAGYLLAACVELLP